MAEGRETRVTGPLAPFAAGFEALVVAEGYSRDWKRHLMGLTAELSQWLGQGGLGASDLTAEVAAEFFAEHGPNRLRCKTARSLRPFVGYLRSLGAAPAECAVPVGRSHAEDELLVCYRQWVVAQRGLASVTADEYVERVTMFLSWWCPDGDFVIAELDGRAILSTVRSAGEVMSGPSLRCVVTALRSFLRFLHATGRTPVSLVSAVPALKTWPRTALPSTLPASDARELVAGCDPATARGRRDAAVLLVVLRLGLRASEVGRLGLGDIDWRGGEMTVRGKGGRHDRLPFRSRSARRSPRISGMGDRPARAGRCS